MLHWLARAVCGLAIIAGSAQAFEVEAVVKKVDLEKRTLLFRAGQMDRTARVDEAAQVRDANGRDLPEGLKAEGLKPGAVVTLRIERVDNRPLIKAIKLTGRVAAADDSNAAARQDSTPVVKQDTSGLTALADLGTGTYKGFEGGLYPGGKNTRPAEHEAAGRELAKQIQPLDADGKSSPDGKIVLLGIGFSNTVQAFQGFMQVARDDQDLNPKLLLVNGAVGGMSAAMISKPDEGRGAQYWATVDDRLKAAGVTRKQVQVVWIKETNPAPHMGGFPRYIEELEVQLEKIVQIVAERFPNVKLAYFSSRTYGGWAKPRPNGTPPGNSEPFSYESGFAVKWLVEKQIKGDPALNYDSRKGAVRAPWLSWSAYLWSNGPIARRDGVRFELDDFRENDRMHESPAGQLKVGKLLLEFFKTDPTSRGWFLHAR